MSGLVKLVVLSDFDGTIVNVDTGTVALSKFANGDWEALEEKYARGEMAFEESLRAQYSMITASERKILDEVDSVAVLRPCFDEVVKYCSNVSVPFIITSGGLDFVIRHILERNSLSDHAKVYAPRARCNPGGMKLTFPRLHHSDSMNFKDDVVRDYQEQGYTVAYVGDGHADYYAIRKADLAFALNGSPSATRCRKDEIRCTEIEDFKPILGLLKKMLEV